MRPLCLCQWLRSLAPSLSPNRSSVLCSNLATPHTACRKLGALGMVVTRARREPLARAQCGWTCIYLSNPTPVPLRACPTPRPCPGGWPARVGVPGGRADPTQAPFSRGLFGGCGAAAAPLPCGCRPRAGPHLVLIRYGARAARLNRPGNLHHRVRLVAGSPTQCCERLSVCRVADCINPQQGPSL